MNQHEKLHYSLQKLIAKSNSKRKKKRKQVPVPLEQVAPSAYVPPVAAFPNSYSYQGGASQGAYYPTTAAEAHQMRQAYRQQLHQEDELNRYTYAGSAATSGYGTPVDALEVAAKTQEQHQIEMQYLTEIEARCQALMKKQSEQYNSNPVSINEMKLLEKSTRTLWIGKISTLITEKRAEEYCKLYGPVLSVNIVSEDTSDTGTAKRCAFVEFATSDGPTKFMQTSNMMMCGERVVCKQANVTAAAAQHGINAGYVNEQTHTITPLFEHMLEQVNQRHQKVESAPKKAKAIQEYFPNLH